MTAPPLTDTDRRELGLDEPRPIPWGVRLLAGLVVVAGVVLWAYAFLGPRSDPPGTMDDQSFGAAAEPICAETTAAVDALPPAHETTDPLVRADVIEEANALLAAQHAALVPLVELTEPGSEDRRRVEEWLGDWETYLGDRSAYAVALRADRGARFRETEKGGDHLSEALTGFADKNRMPSCAPTGDVG